jgi:hypothetical protein
MVDRVFGVALRHLWSGWVNALMKPETVVSWHRAGFSEMLPARSETLCMRDRRQPFVRARKAANSEKLDLERAVQRLVRKRHILQVDHFRMASDQAGVE